MGRNKVVFDDSAKGVTYRQTIFLDCLLVFLNVSDFFFFVSLYHILEPGDLCGYLEFLDRWPVETRVEPFISAVVRFILRISTEISGRFGLFSEKIFVIIRVIPGNICNNRSHTRKYL